MRFSVSYLPSSVNILFLVLTVSLVHNPMNEIVGVLFVIINYIISCVDGITETGPSA